jgi:membrane peptidoglycan carboxypeptidase
MFQQHPGAFNRLRAESIRETPGTNRWVKRSAYRCSVRWPPECRCNRMPEQESEEARPVSASQKRYVVASCLLLTVAVIVLGAFYLKYASLVDRTLNQGAFSGTFDIYAASPPLLVTNVSREGREKRRIVHFSELPQSLVDAVVSVEDKRFFRHEGFDPLRMMKAAYVDLRDGRREQGASTLSMQLARNLLLDSLT